MGMHVICILALSSILFIGTFIIAFFYTSFCIHSTFFLLYTPQQLV